MLQTDYTVLERIQNTADVKTLTADELEQLCDEIRQYLLQTVSKTGGHLASNLGVVELTVALHRSFSLPHDQIVWDVGHQCYTHKLLTGRREGFAQLRQENGVAGFPRPNESECDAFVTGHSSTSVSAANGMAKAKTLTGDDGYVVAVIGDGALTGGLAYEGLSNAGRSKDRLIVILNDNRMSISTNVGFVARHLAVLRARPRYLQWKNRTARVLRHIPLLGKPIYKALLHTKLSLKRLLYKNSSWFEQMGYYYLGPVDGHNLTALQNAMQTARDITGPVLLHVQTVKGKGYPFAEKFPDKFHGIAPFNVETGETAAGNGSFSATFGETMCRLAAEDDRVCAITAAMTGGTGLTAFAEQYHKRCFDVGIAEEHAVTFASGLAKNNALPVFAVYSTFLQRSYDQILNDTALNSTHIVLAIDRAGAVPADGETHQGVFDVPFLKTIPRVTIFSPTTYDELSLRLRQAIYDVDGVVAVRYPKGGEWALPFDYKPDYASYTVWDKPSAKAAVISYGRLFANVAKAAQDKDVTLVKLNKIFPLEQELVELLKSYDTVLFAEECSEEGSIAQALGECLLQNGFKGHYLRRGIAAVPTTSTAERALETARLDVASISEWIQEALYE
ncbi:MAG: 1-deoxy-D-xylulose-5-phosphate synthase [Ruminococcaceae bacterium]|nr:1-deoxy-D-xylulose-5-phosphate synthase [Oscillospiraceae bacterium]